MPASEPQVQSRLFGFFKVLLSVWLVFHVIVLVVMPNGASIMGRRLGPLIGPYGAMLGLNTAWNFFSPDPAHTMYLKFTVSYEDADGKSLKEAEEIFMPPEKDQGVWSLSKRRELYAMRYMILDPRRVDAVLGPWLCRTKAGATSIHIDHVINSVPTLDEANLFSDQKVGDLGKEFNFISKDYRCSQVNDEVNL